MIPALWISKTGLDAQQTNISVTSNNLANASTVGFKRSRAIFEDATHSNLSITTSACKKRHLSSDTFTDADFVPYLKTGRAGSGLPLPVRLRASRAASLP